MDLRTCWYSGVFGGDGPVLEVIGTGGEIYEALVSLSGLEDVSVV